MKNVYEIMQETNDKFRKKFLEMARSDFKYSNMGLTSKAGLQTILGINNGDEWFAYKQKIKKQDAENKVNAMRKVGINVEILNPNCSEVVWKLNLGNKSSAKHESWTDQYPNQALENGIKSIRKLIGKNKNAIDVIELEILNTPDGGNPGYIEASVDIARDVVRGKLKLEDAKRRDEAVWHY